MDIISDPAALKHVPLCEYNPFDAVKTNVLGTQNVLDAALDKNVKKVIMVSTDKAVNPINVMGATKLLSERLTISANYYRGNKRTIFSCVRFGNVLNSRGSVVPTFRKQIKNGGPVTLTDPKMTRFIMHIHDAAGLILKAGHIAEGKEIFILKMHAVNIIDLAEVMIENLAKNYGHISEEIEIEIIGTRLGEKMYEELMTDNETPYAIDNGELFILNSKNQANHNNNIEYNSNSIEKLSKNDIREIITDILTES